MKYLYIHMYIVATVDDLTHYFTTLDGFVTLFFDDINDLHDYVYFLWGDLVGFDSSVLVDDHPRHVSIHVLYLQRFLSSHLKDVKRKRIWKQ